jgi:hypothetical protein
MTSPKFKSSAADITAFIHAPCDLLATPLLKKKAIRESQTTPSFSDEDAIQAR